MKPTIIRSMVTNRKNIEDLFGHEIAKRCLFATLSREYAIVLKFPFNKVVVSGELRRALRKMPGDGAATLVVAMDLTREARDLALKTNCDLLTLKEFFGWTDESYQDVRQNMPGRR